MSKIKHPVLKQINDLYLEYEKLEKTGEGYYDGRQLYLYDKASDLLISYAKDFTSQDIIEGFYYGTEMLQRCTSGLMIWNEIYHPDYLEVMVQSIKDDRFVSNYKFIFFLQEHLNRKELIDLLKVSLHSQDNKVQENSLYVVMKEKLIELIPDVEILSNLPDVKKEEITIPDFFSRNKQVYIDHVKSNRVLVREQAIKTLQYLKSN